MIFTPFCLPKFWSPQYKCYLNLLESLQSRATKRVKDLERKPYKEWQRSLSLFILEKRRLKRPHCILQRFSWGEEEEQTVTGPVTEFVGMVRSYIRRSLCWILGKSYSPRAWFGTGTGFPGKRSQNLPEFKILDNILKPMVWFFADMVHLAKASKLPSVYKLLCLS